MFAVPEIISGIVSSKHEAVPQTRSAKIALPGFSDPKRCAKAILTGSIVGTVMGAIPRAGAPDSPPRRCCLASPQIPMDTPSSATATHSPSLTTTET
ncbi:hypothetical protein [uncultured Oscillibacter sp.]|uniref:hypothetical protein n=1 Tax=uncultured Oscillibacter sp. TaxID=876091 RepID=UPI00341B885C